MTTATWTTAPARPDEADAATLLREYMEEMVEQRARAAGADRIRLDTRSDLVEARALYARHGYVEIRPTPPTSTPSTGSRRCCRQRLTPARGRAK